MDIFSSHFLYEKSIAPTNIFQVCVIANENLSSWMTIPFNDSATHQ